MTKPCPTGLGRGYAPGRIPLSLSASYGALRVAATTEIPISPEVAFWGGVAVLGVGLARRYLAPKPTPRPPAPDRHGSPLRLLREGARLYLPTPAPARSGSPLRLLKLGAQGVSLGDDLDLLGAE